ncbi:TetR/AcrR family transcriptional regulator C-terminal domain-containing protein [Nonomuraea aurantiaca]|uniref:TetR/AcrR family transcriptional regulator C-terminal domain-containing protein n=1 Tax=Nonomuraea aurantiaca TaxID=2878562 RepID=UPI001CD9AC1A|nr:TetR/AcrR family transcriptional regulator C-terminal domain-containing protein [Nonomuraea aurantiaca]MCA2224880.1 TetR/AcrR family transcriptional regulator C-terminal domain-containing protein [Nonomuraea aurantiaca]
MLLEEAVRRNLEIIGQRATAATAARPADEDGRATLERMARVVWEVLESDRDLIRIMMRESDEFPDLFERMWQGVLADVCAQGADWIIAQKALGTVDVEDPEATAAVLLASLTYYPVLRAMIGHTPGDLASERFLAAWIEHAAATLKLR